MTSGFTDDGDGSATSRAVEEDAVTDDAAVDDAAVDGEAAGAAGNYEIVASFLALL